MHTSRPIDTSEKFDIDGTEALYDAAPAPSLLFVAGHNHAKWMYNLSGWKIIGTDQQAKKEELIQMAKSILQQSD